MALIEKLFSRSDKFSPVAPKDPGLSRLFSGLFSNTASGVSVTPDNAMQISAVYAAVSIISESIGMLPWDVYQKEGDGKAKAINDPRYSLLARKPNRFQNTMEYRETMVSMLLLRGRAVAEKIANNAGIVTDLIPLHPDTIQPFLAPDGTIAIAHTAPGHQRRILLSDEVIDLRGLSLDGVTCVSPITEQAETLGIAKAAEMYAGKYFGNGTVVSGVLETDEGLSDSAYKRLAEWTERHQGVGRSHNPAILEEGLKWRQVSVSPEDSQLLQTRSYQIEDIARIYRIPAYKLQRMDSVKFNTTEQQAIDFVTDTLLPRVTRFELAHNLALFSEIEQRTLTSEINLKGLLRGDSKTRSEFYRTMWNMGVYNANKILDLENENPIEGGERYYVPVNVMPVDRVDDNLDQKTRPQPMSVEQNSFPMVRSAFERIHNAEQSAISRGKDMVSFYQKHGEFIHKVTAQIVESLEGVIKDDNIRQYFNDFYVRKMIEHESGTTTGAEDETLTFTKWVEDNAK